MENKKDNAEKNPPKSKKESDVKDLAKMNKGELDDVLTQQAIVADLKNYSDFMKQIDDFVTDQLKDGEDFGLSFDKAEKPTLFKSGAEKVNKLLKLEAVIENDWHSHKMAGGTNGLISLICYLIPIEMKGLALKLILEHGREFKHEIYRMVAVSEGRGMMRVLEKKTTNENIAVKVCEKRAIVNATLRIGIMSSKFTQDMGDEGKEDKKADGEKVLTEEEQYVQEKTGMRLQIADYISHPDFDTEGRKWAIRYAMNPNVKLGDLKKVVVRCRKVFEDIMTEVQPKVDTPEEEKPKADTPDVQEETKGPDATTEDVINVFEGAQVDIDELAKPKEQNGKPEGEEGPQEELKFEIENPFEKEKNKAEGEK